MLCSLYVDIVQKGKFETNKFRSELAKFEKHAIFKYDLIIYSHIEKLGLMHFVSSPLP